MNGIVESSLYRGNVELSNINMINHNYGTRNSDKLRLSRVTRNWGKQCVYYQSLKDWNELDRDLEILLELKFLNETFLNVFSKPCVTRNWGKQRVCYQSLKDWNVDRDTRNSTSIRNFYIKSF